MKASSRGMVSRGLRWAVGGCLLLGMGTGVTLVWTLPSRDCMPRGAADDPIATVDGGHHRGLAPADGFDFPVNPPDAKHYYNAQGFQVNHHLGEDWNGVGGGNTDKGDPVFSVAKGVVTVAEDAGPGWGNVVRVVHNVGSLAQPRLIESLYAHLDTVLVNVADTVRRGHRLGTMGDAHGAYWAHLHLEMRWKAGLPLGGGYSADTTGFLHPTAYILSHRPSAAQGR